MDFDKYDEDDEEQFEQDLYIEFNVENHPKREKLYSLSLQYSHYAGYEEIYNCFKDLVDLIKE